MLQTIQEGIHKILALKEFVPIRIAQIGDDDGGDLAIAHVEEFKEGVDLFGFQGQIT
jgi:hypothetical protein